MTTPAEVVRAAMEMQQGSRLDRARSAMQALNLFTTLSADDKRALAVLVAQRVAPELVPRIQSESGLDLTAEQSRAVLDMVRRLDGDDLAELQAAVATPEARRTALAGVGAAAATATGLDDVVQDQPLDREAVARATGGAGPATTREVPRPDDDTRERLQARVRVLDEHVDTLTEELAEARRALSEAEATGRTAQAQVHDAESRAEAAEHRAEERTRAAERAEREAIRAAERARDAEARLRHARVRGADPAGPAPGPADGEATAAVAGVGVGGNAGTDQPIEAWERRLHELSVAGALRLVTRSVPALGARSGDDRRRVVLAIPDGWARRRAIQRLVEGGAVTPDEAPGLVATLASTGNQVFAARSLLAAGVVDLGRLSTALAPDALARLERALPVR